MNAPQAEYADARTVVVRAATAEDAPALAALHAAAFDRPWDADYFKQAIAAEYAAHVAFLPGRPDAAGFILWRDLAGEAEIVTLAVDPARRHRGVARNITDQQVHQRRDRNASGCQTVHSVGQVDRVGGEGRH